MIEIEISKLYYLFSDSSGICTDSRAIKDDCLFLALKGENFDGNKFAEAALKKGAKYSIVDDPKLANNEQIFYVQNGLKALQELASFHRALFNIPIIAITGSNGKTTTKELTAAVLSQTYKCHYTKGNFNNHIGVPLTLLDMDQYTEVAIIEIGANHINEIAALCQIAKPTHGLITNIGKAHLEGFGGIEGVKKGKSELYDYLASNNGVAFINRNEKFLTDLSSQIGYRRVFYGEYDPVDREKWLHVKNLGKPGEYLTFRFWDTQSKAIEGRSNLIGDYNLPNLITAICLGTYFKVGEEQITNAIADYIPSNNRSQVELHKGGKVILDAYNANPSSVALALTNFGEMLDEFPKIIVLGAMKELGKFTEKEHFEIAQQAVHTQADQIFLIGIEFQQAATQLNLNYFQNADAFKDWMPDNFFTNHLVLIKGSRSIALEKILI